MLTPERLKNYLHRNLTRTEKLLLILGTVDRPALLAEIREHGRNAGLREIQSWNVTQILSRAKGMVINTSAGWELIDGGRERLAELGFTSTSADNFRKAGGRDRG